MNAAIAWAPFEERSPAGEEGGQPGQGALPPHADRAGTELCPVVVVEDGMAQDKLGRVLAG